MRRKYAIRDTGISVVCCKLGLARVYSQHNTQLYTLEHIDTQHTIQNTSIIEGSCISDWLRALTMCKSSSYGQHIELIIARPISLDQASPQPYIHPSPQHRPTYNAFLNALLNGIICTLLKSHTPPST